MEQGLSPHTKAVCRENLALNVPSNSDSWKNWARERQSESMARVSEASQNGITKLSQHRSNKKKCITRSSFMKMSWQNGQQQYLLALVECLINVRLGKTFLYIEGAQLRQATGDQTGRIRVLSN